MALTEFEKTPVCKEWIFLLGKLLLKLPCPKGKVPGTCKSTHPLTKSLTKTTKKWPGASKMRELLALKGQA